MCHFSLYRIEMTGQSCQSALLIYVALRSLSKTLPFGFGKLYSNAGKLLGPP